MLASRLASPKAPRFAFGILTTCLQRIVILIRYDFGEMGVFDWNCNICGTTNDVPWLELVREGPSCQNCHSSVRQRQILSSVNKLLQTLDEKKPRVIGISDADLVANTLKNKRNVRYVNTFFDERPRLDISAPRAKYNNSADIVICSDVLEHVMFPVQSAIRGLYKILKPGGYVVVTVPYTFHEPNQEHFPWMKSYEASQNNDGSWRVLGIAFDGTAREVKNPIFHGGPGNTLEMRLLSRAELISNFRDAGFADVDIDEQDQRDHGIRMQLGVLVAQRPR